MRGRFWSLLSLAMSMVIGVAALAGCDATAGQSSPATHSPLAHPAADDKPLVGPVWRLDGSRATLKITGDQLLATNGCQSLAGTITTRAHVFTVDSPRLSAGPVCPAVDTPGLAVFPVLSSGSVLWEVDGDQLTITAGDGRALHYSAA